MSKSHAMIVGAFVLGLITIKPAAYAENSRPDSSSVHEGVNPDRSRHNIYIAPYLGVGNLSFKGNALTSGHAIDKDGALTGVNFTYVSPYYLVANVGYSLFTHKSYHTFDSSDFYFTNEEYQAAIGVELRNSFGFRFTPKVGRSHWKLQPEDSENLFAQTNPGKSYRSGYNNFWNLSVVKELNSKIALGATMGSNSYAFGNFRAIAFTVSIHL